MESPLELGDLATRALEVPSRLSESRQGATNIDRSNKFITTI